LHNPCVLMIRLHHAEVTERRIANLDVIMVVEVRVEISNTSNNVMVVAATTVTPNSIFLLLLNLVPQMITANIITSSSSSHTINHEAAIAVAPHEQVGMIATAMVMVEAAAAAAILTVPALHLLKHQH
jgi:hypothetical protein